MKVGDLVVPLRTKEEAGLGFGLIIESYFNDSDLTEYFYVAWKHEAQWWSELELKVIDEPA
tara:strand:+ start:1450 stop:1632 length:183 start_codon:yes stop_codon:yes gene_type:complete